MSAWAALDAAADPVGHSLALRRAHEAAVGRSSSPPVGVRSLVADSWQRSLAAGVAPEAAGAPVLLRDDDLETARSVSPLAPVVDTILACLSDAGPHVVAIGDADANLLWIGGDDRAVESAREMRFEVGAGWSERRAGTNAVGTAAALDHALQIFSAEHLVAAVHPWTCSAAPVHDPVSGELIGVIDLTSELRSVHPNTLGLVMLAARTAEATLRAGELERAERLRARWESAIAGRRSATMLVDRRGRVIAARGVAGAPSALGAPVLEAGEVRSADGRVWEADPLEGGGAVLWLCRRQAPRLTLTLLGRPAEARFGLRTERGLRSLEMLAVLAMHPEGLTAEQLALALYGERGKTVTVRAQLHRLRASLGEQLIQTQPYRLAAPVEADWLRVRRLVTAGRPGAALSAYRGALLPASDAPAIREARAMLDESVRRSVLTTGDPDLLERWLAHPSGSDDVAAARARVASLPAGDPRRAAATATAALLARRLG